MSLARQRPPSPFASMPAAGEFTVVSNDFSEGDVLPMAHVFSGAGGANLSPHLAWSDFPAETKGFAVTVFDPDAPTLSGWWHWLVTATS